MRKPRSYPVLAIALLVGLLLAACGSTSGSTTTAPAGSTTAPGGATTTAAPGTFDVTIDNFAFTPPQLTVPAGSTVTWTNNQSTAHTVTSDTGVFASSTLAQGGTFQFTFSQVGEFPYHCSLHPSMTAVIVVTG